MRATNHPARLGHLSAALLVAHTVFAQSPAVPPPGPPTCGDPTQTIARSIRPPETRPTAQSLADEAAPNTIDPHTLVAEEPANFGIARYRLADYAECIGASGCYWADLDAQTRRAEAELDRVLAERRLRSPKQAHAEKLAIVLDIDETTLSSFCEEKREDYGFIPAMWNEWAVTPAAAVPIPGTLRLFQRARAAGLTVFFLTGRAHTIAAATEHNLALAGFTGYQQLITRSDAELHLPTIEYKSSHRATIVRNGYTLLLNMGDQWSDLNGTPRAEVNVKLPNPFYYLP